MNLPFFFVKELNDKQILLVEDTSKHIINVLRMQKGEEILLTDGKGKKAKAIIVDDNRKKCVVEILSIEAEQERKNKVAVGISLIKNSSRFEWFLEKTTEIGVSEIIPLICARTKYPGQRYASIATMLATGFARTNRV
jgi:16S rRNA (uracil1498-N3)-methyltransferase